METAPKILIIEDEVLIASYIKKILLAADFTTIKMAHDPEQAQIEMDTFLPDIILMDINLSGINAGIELAKSKNKNASVIYITGQNDYRLMNLALQTNPDSYLSKPIKKVDLLAAINLAIIKNRTKYMVIKDGYNNIQLKTDDIIYLKSDDNYCDIFTVSNKYVVRQSLQTILNMLPSEIFKQSHRSFVVNKSKIQKISSTTIFINEIEIPLSRSFSKQFR